MSINKKRGGAAARGAVAATVATAVLLGGFGGFSLWQDTVAGGITDSINTGQLMIDSIDEGEWMLAQSDTDMDGSGAPGTEVPIDLETFLVSPGDELVWNSTVDVLVTGTDMLGQLSVDDSSITIDPSWDGLITVELDDADTTILPDEAMQTVNVKLRVKFSESITGLIGQDISDVIDLTALTVQLDQVQAPPAP